MFSFSVKQKLIFFNLFQKRNKLHFLYLQKLHLLFLFLKTEINFAFPIYYNM